MNPALDKLIEFALADGVLSEKERTVLFRKARELGVDEDELEIILEGKLHTLQKAGGHSSVKYGDVRKCPSCNAIVNSFSTVCSECGYEFRNIGANNSVKELSNRLDNVVKECEAKSYKSFLGIISLGPQYDEEERQREIATRQKHIIKNFPVPNTREDLLELLHFIQPRTKGGYSSDKLTTVWRIKFREILNRAKFAYATDKNTLSELERLERDYQVSIFSKISLFYKNKSPIQKFTFWSIFMFFTIILLGVLIMSGLIN